MVTKSLAIQVIHLLGLNRVRRQCPSRLIGLYRLGRVSLRVLI